MLENKNVETIMKSKFLGNWTYTPVEKLNRNGAKIMGFLKISQPEFIKQIFPKKSAHTLTYVVKYSINSAITNSKIMCLEPVALIRKLAKF